ncbi:hypothetical protein KAH27_08245 [bacterium]|nr:hypothetical protein [bacterium]
MGTKNNITEDINIKDIHLVHVNSRREPVLPPETASVNIACEPTLEPLHTDARHCTVICKFTLLIHDEEKDLDVMKIVVEYCVVYELTKDIDQVQENDPKSLAASAVFNCWPSLRELVHRLVIDAGLSPFILPTLTDKKLKGLYIKHKIQAAE